MKVSRNNVAKASKYNLYGTVNVNAVVRSHSDLMALNLIKSRDEKANSRKMAPEKNNSDSSICHG